MNDQVNQAHGIVVGYDGTPSARLALEWAAETARQLGKPLTIMHSVSLSMVPAFPAVDVSQVEPIVEQAAKSLVEEGAERASSVLEAAEIRTQYWLGSPAGQLVEASRDADLLVVGSRGRGRVRAGILGSTSYAVAAHAHCPVVVLRGPGEFADGDDDLDHVRPVRPGPEHPVVVGVDGSDISTRAVEAAATWAQREHAPLHIVAVAQTAPLEAWAYAETVRSGTDEPNPLRAQAEQAAQRAASRVRSEHPGVDVKVGVLNGDPGRVIAELGGHAGLVVIGSRGHGGFAGMLLGSVSHRVIHDAVCPVMVVR